MRRRPGRWLWPALGLTLAADGRQLVGTDRVAVLAAQLGADAPAAGFVVQLDRRLAVRLQPAVAPLHQRHQRGEELGAHLGQPVQLAGAGPGS